MYLHTNGNQLTLTDYQIIKWYNERLRSSSSTMLSTHIPCFQQLSCSVHTVIQLRCTQLWRIKHTKMSSSQALWSVAESHVQINFFRSRILYLQINSIIVFFHLGIFEAFSLSQMRKKCLITILRCLFCWLKPQQLKSCYVAKITIFIFSKR